MVTISEILKKIIDNLPPMLIDGTPHEVRFFEGVLSDAKMQMNVYKESNISPYPCVWLIRDFPEVETANKLSINNMNLILLLDTNNSYKAPERLEKRINPYLIPLKDNLIKGLQSAGVFVASKTFTKLTFLSSANAAIIANNSKANAKVFADYLDGLKLVLNISYEMSLNLICYDN